MMSEHDDSISLEQDLLASPLMLAKVRGSAIYAQHLYAAMCNQMFAKNEVWSQLKGETWSCSWRYAGGIVADMREQGDYLDWYCSGIKGSGLTDEEYNQLSRSEQELYIETRKYVGEGHVTNEIRDDLLTLGWHVVPDAYEYSK